MNIWQDRAKKDENYSSVIDPKDKSGLKAAYMKIIHEGAIKSFIKEIKPGEKVLDFGCGTGRILEYDLFLNADYYGVDISPEMIKNARRKWENRPHVNFYCYNGISLPFKHKTFNYIITTWVFQHIVEDNKLKELIAELAKLLRPNGALLFIEQIRDNEYIEILNGVPFKKYRTARHYKEICRHKFAEINYELVPGVGNGFFYRIMSVLRIGFMKRLIPLFVSTDKLIYGLIFARSAFMKKIYIGKKWIDFICYCKKNDEY
ncbi:MAG: class I SAM-dependent methyltransferase [Deltaproteobacteria bacterium]|nr:class I SAM-dependent methyltransferase [Deltaproteobacteria bacterium]